MIIPPYLKQGDKVGIIAPARHIEQSKYESIINILTRYGFNTVRGNTTYLEYGPFAGTDTERAADLQSMINDPSINAIFCLRGGYGTVRIIDKIDFSFLKENPKWIIGFSDITILHNVLHNAGIVSVHGQMPLNFAERTENKGLDKLISALKGESVNYRIEMFKLNRVGVSSAYLVGGNVAILSSLIGTPYDINTDGKILFIEEVGEYLYRFDRLMYHLKLSGKLSKLKGLIVGGLTDMKDNIPEFGQSVEEIVHDLVKEYNYPVCFNFPAGHIKENFPLIFGKKIKMDISENSSVISF